MAPIEASGNSNATATLEAFRARALNSVKGAATPKSFANAVSTASQASSAQNPALIHSVVQAKTPVSKKAGFASLPDHIDVAEIQQIAQRSGYVGVTPGAIQRAYLYGESLLTDIRA